MIDIAKFRDTGESHSVYFGRGRLGVVPPGFDPEGPDYAAERRGGRVLSGLRKYRVVRDGTVNEIGGTFDEVIRDLQLFGSPVVEAAEICDIAAFRLNGARVTAPTVRTHGATGSIQLGRAWASTWVDGFTYYSGRLPGRNGSTARADQWPYWGQVMEQWQADTAAWREFFSVLRESRLWR